MIITLSSMVFIYANSRKNESNAEKVEKRLQHALNDIKVSFQLDDEKMNNYKKITYVNAINMHGDIAREIDNLDQMAPIGCTEPTYYISNGSDEVMILFKTADGTNVMIKSKKIKDTWELSEKKVKGAPILDINNN